MRHLKYCHFVFAIFLVIAVLLGSMFFWAYNGAYYHSAQQKYAISEVTGIDQADLMNITTVLITYMQGERPDLDVSVVVNGQLRLVFNERELHHMVDVRYLLGITHLIYQFCVLTVSIMSLWWIKKRRWQNILYGVFGAVLLFTAIGIGALVMSVIDFSGAFTLFHKIVFTNDLWMLNPQTDILLQMMPLGFFYDMVIRIVMTAFGIMTALGAVALVLIRRRLKASDY